MSEEPNKELKKRKEKERARTQLHPRLSIILNAVEVMWLVVSLAALTDDQIGAALGRSCRRMQVYTHSHAHTLTLPGLTTTLHCQLLSNYTEAAVGSVLSSRALQQLLWRKR